MGPPSFNGGAQRLRQAFLPLKHVGFDKSSSLDGIKPSLIQNPLHLMKIIQNENLLYNLDGVVQLMLLYSTFTLIRSRKERSCTGPAGGLVMKMLAYCAGIYEFDYSC